MERKKVNNAFYDELKEGWHRAHDHPIALLRAENRARIPWIQHHIPTKSAVLDIGCGGGFLTNALAQAGHAVSGVDLSKESLRIAAQSDTTGSVRYSCADAYALPFEERSFDIVCAMDLLEHVEAPEKVISEAARVLRSGGRFFFHTFNRNWVSYLIALKGVEWFMPNVPKNMHLYRNFIRPCELERMLSVHGLEVEKIRGLNPVCDVAFFKTLLTRRISEHFRFKLGRSLLCGYMGFATLHSISCPTAPDAERPA
ncbi:MAG: 3-demethylubiquinone-9 3-O-methyltransferase [Chlamydiales bacterium]|nr:3-demethylubiquinone-9 3-O-methyltransferase [Chlamydiales bacterium]